MISLILKATHNIGFKDTVAVIRGTYRVLEGVTKSIPGQQVRRSSWMDDIVEEKGNTGEGNEQKDQKQNKEIKIKILEKQRIRQVKIEQKQKQYLKEYKQIRKTTQFQQKQTETSKITSSRIGRIFQFGKLGLDLATASFFSKGKGEQNYTDMAEKISNQLCKMRGAPLKLAQMLSIQQEGLIPAPIRKAFQKARESAHVIPEDQVNFMMARNLGQNWRQKFKIFTNTPFASASIGQVHRATLLNNTEVAVKVQYHGVKQSIESDIQNLGLLMKLPGVAPKGMFVDRILKNTRQELIQQCNYTLQKFFQEVYSHFLQKSLKQQAELYRVPQIYPQLSTEQILTSTFLTGIKIKDLENENYPQELRDQVGRRIMKLTFRQLFEMGIMQSDPNPSNFTYNPKTDQLNLYDFGATHIYKPQFLKEYYRIIKGSVNEDADEIWQASKNVGFVTGEQNSAMRNGHIDSILITGEPLRFQGKYDFGAQAITSRIYNTIPLMLKNRLKSPPEQVYSLHRKLSGSYLACIRLKAKVDCSKIWKQIQFDTMASNQYPQMRKRSSN